MRIVVAATLLLLLSGVTAHAYPLVVGKLTRIDPATNSKFSFPYLLYIPERAATHADGGAKTHVLVVPNNTGKVSDDFSVHYRAAALQMNEEAKLADKLRVVALMPVFPRPKSQWKLYTHALDRDCLTTGDPELRRLDLQLLAMIDHASARLRERNWPIARRVLIKGFSASGMFANRFAVLHPRRVLAASIGSPGGWPIVPVATWRTERLRYPIGVADLEQLTGRQLDADALSKVSMFVFLGDQDTNDSVAYRDGYEEEDADLINRLFGSTPVKRWDAATEIYASQRGMTKFKLYRQTGHRVTPEMARDVQAFLESAMKADQSNAVP